VTLKKNARATQPTGEKSVIITLLGVIIPRVIIFAMSLS
jgi:hypothetical protein